MSALSLRFAKIREQFPALQQKIKGQNLVYLDSAATSLKPQPFVDRVTQFYSFETANVHRGAHYLGDQATQSFELARSRVQKFLNAAAVEEIVFTKGTTEAINLVASTWAEGNLKAGDEILITVMEHHANIVPWQMIAERKGARVVCAGLLPNGELDLNDFKAKLNSKTKLVAVTACSNVLGVNNDIHLLTTLAHAAGSKILIDGAQLVSQKSVDVQEVGCDFFTFSAHKIFGPFGFGVLYGKQAILKELPPYQGGGSMIAKVSLSGTTFNEIPFRFEAGTPHIEGAIGLSAALDYVQEIGFADIHAYEMELLTKATAELKKISSLVIYGDVQDKAPVISFNLKGAHHSDVAQILDQEGVAVRSGHHCAQPLMEVLGVSGTVRASFSIYNNEEDIQRLIKALNKAQEMLL
jgi:cysteine desulfurase/selenocysteine lyase